VLRSWSWLACLTFRVVVGRVGFDGVSVAGSALGDATDAYRLIATDSPVLADPERVAAVERGRRVLAALPMPLQGIARLAARLLDAPIGLVTLVGAEREHFAGSYGVPASLAANAEVPSAYSVCKYTITTDAPVRCEDMRTETDPHIRDHPLAAEYGVRAFLGIPLRDAEDRPLGSVTVLDTRPRTWTDANLLTLIEVADLIGPVPTTSSPLDPVLAAVEPAEVFDAVAEAFLVLDPDEVITGWNKAAEEMLGYTAAQACGQPVEQFLHAEYPSRPVREAVTALLAGTAPGNQRQLPGTVLVHHRDGRPLHVQIRLSVLRSAAGAMVCAFLTDVTAQVLAAEAATRAAEAADTQRAFAHALLDSLNEGVVAIDADGRAVVFNRALRSMTGLAEALPPHDAMTACIPMLHHLDGAPARAGDLPIAQALRGHTVRDTEIILARTGLPNRHLATSAQPIVATDGQRIGAVATIRDITARRRTERFRICEQAVSTLLDQPGSLEQIAPAVMRTLAQSLGWPYAELRLVDPAGDTLNVIAHYTAPGYQIETLRPDRLPPGMASIPTAVWTTRQPIWEPDITASPWMTGPEAQARAHAYTQQGLRAILSVPVPDGDEPLGVLTCFADTAEHDQFILTGLLTGIATQIGKFLTDRRAAALATELDRTRADFTALVGHDMRTPLTTIAAYTQLLLDDPTPRPATDQQLLEGIDRNTTQLRDLVDALLDLAALESGDHTLATHQVDLSTLLHAACQRATAAMTTAGLTLDAAIEPLVHVVGDRDRLRALADALLANAIAADGDGGSLHVALEISGGTAHLTVTHNGPGPASDPFGRFSPANTTGTGHTDATPTLGLALARVITERHGGTLTLTEHTDAITIAVRLPLTTRPDLDRH